MGVSKELLDILACPRCKGDIHLDKRTEKIICDKCKLKFSVTDNIPGMLIEDAEKM